MLTQEQENVMQQLEQYCKDRNTNVWVGAIDYNTKQVLNQLEQRGYIAPYMQAGDYWTVMPTRTQGMERDAIVVEE
jgi:hypothetical protein